MGTHFMSELSLFLAIICAVLPIITLVQHIMPKNAILAVGNIMCILALLMKVIVSMV